MMKNVFLLLLLTIGAGLHTGMAMKSAEKENGMLSVTIGTTEQYQHPEAFRMPYDFHWQSSLSQTLYYPHEIGLDRAMLAGLSYYTNFQDNLENKEVRVWVGETETASLYNNWIDPQTLTLVFDGTVDFLSGENTVDIMFDTPYEYNGGVLVVYSYRVWDTDYFGWGNRFYTTETPGSYRTRQVNEDNNTLDPLNPATAGNWRVAWFPTVTLQFPLQYLADIEGTVIHEGQPLEGVLVAITGTSAHTLTDQNGDYALSNIMADTYEIAFSKQGYHTHLEENVTLQGGQTTILNISMNAVENFNVSGMIQGNDGQGLENAIVLLEGMTSYQVSSGADGNFVIEDVFEGNYSLTVTADGFEEYHNENIIVSGSDLYLGVITLTEIIIPPLGLTATVSQVDPGEVMLSWYHGTTTPFRYDDGFHYWIGVQEGNENMVFGTVFRHYAVLSELAWYLSSEMQQHPVVSLWLFGLDQTGQPDREMLLWSAADVSNTDDHWNVFDLGTGVVAENGFLFGISAPNGTFLGTDNGESEQWPFRQNTHFFTANINQEAFAAIETISNISYNFNLRAMGIDNGEIHFDGNDIPKQRWQETDFIVAEKMARTGSNIHPVAGNNPAKDNSRALLGYNIFLNDLNVPIGFSEDNSFVLSELEEGNHTAGVQAVYTSGNSEIILVDFYTQGTTDVLHPVAHQISIYPNPFSEQLSVSFSDQRFFNMKIFDGTGRLLVKKSRSIGTVTVSTGKWLPGVYFIHINDDNGYTHTKKIIKH